MMPDNVYRSNIYEPIHIHGRFKPNGSSAIDNSVNKGPRGWTVAYAATGVYTITLDQKYSQCIFAEAHLSIAAATDAGVQVGAIDVSSAKTVVLHGVTPSDGNALEFTADADTWVHFHLVLAGTVTK